MRIVAEVPADRDALERAVEPLLKLVAVAP